MSYYINPVEADRVVFLSFEAGLNAAQAQAARQAVTEIIGGTRWNRIVVDATQLHHVPSASHLLYFCESLCLDLPPDARIALVVRPDQIKHALFVDTIANNRGLTLTCFADADYALAWVKHTPLAKGTNALAPAAKR